MALIVSQMLGSVSMSSTWIGLTCHSHRRSDDLPPAVERRSNVRLSRRDSKLEALASGCQFHKGHLWLFIEQLKWNSETMSGSATFCHSCDVDDDTEQ